MFRGTTPKFTFRLPIEVSSITALCISFRQAENLSIEKTQTDCALDGNTLTVALTEKETLSLRASMAHPLEVQLRVGVGETRMASQIFRVNVEQILKDGAL